MDRLSRPKINKEIMALTVTSDHIDLVYIYRTLLPQNEEYAFLLRGHGPFSRVDHLFGHKASLNKFTKKTSLRQMKMKTKLSKIYGILQKQF